MPYPRHLDSKSIEDLFEIVERNRWERLREHHLSDEPPELDPFEAIVDNDLKPEDVRIVLFGKEGPFAFSMIEMFRTETAIAFFDDPERMISFCLTYKITHYLLDLDPPADCYQATDIYNALKMLLPESQAHVCTKRPQSLEARGLKMHGAELFEKPVLRDDVIGFCRLHLHEGE